MWVAVGVALERPLAVAFSRDIAAEAASVAPADAGHLAAQEVVLRLARPSWEPDVELPLTVGRMPHVGDVVLRSRELRALLLIEISNRTPDLGNQARSTDRKADARKDMALLLGGEAEPYRAAVGWLLVDNAANRALAGRYPEILRRKFPGSSSALVEAIVRGAPPPERPALAWIDPRRARDPVFPMRSRTAASA